MKKRICIIEIAEERDHQHNKEMKRMKTEHIEEINIDDLYLNDGDIYDIYESYQENRKQELEIEQ